MIRVKICGIRSLEEARSVLDRGADALGFHVDLEHAKCPIGAATAEAIIAKLPPFISSVVVTSKTEPKELLRIAKATGANTLQLHGDASPDTIRAVKAVFFNMKVCAAVHVAGDEALEKVKEFEDAADAVILDSKAEDSGARGGTGKTHDWSMSRRIVEMTSMPVILAGGLAPENVAQAIQTVHPYAVDVNSGVSNPDGTKDLEKVRLFIERAKSAL